jgi:hypothetical protein
VEKKTKDPCFFQNGGRKGDETQQIIQNALQRVTTGSNGPASPSLLPCRNQTVSSVCRHRISKIKRPKTKLLTNDDLRPGLDYFSFVT